MVIKVNKLFGTWLSLNSHTLYSGGSISLCKKIQKEWYITNINKIRHTIYCTLFKADINLSISAQKHLKTYILTLVSQKTVNVKCLNVNLHCV